MNNRRCEEIDKRLAEVVAKFVDALHHMYPGINIKPIDSFEDENFTFEIKSPLRRFLKSVIKNASRRRMSTIYSFFPMLFMCD